MFILFVIAGYRNIEITDVLGIPEGKSKSQLNLVKSIFEDLLDKRTNFKVNLP